MWRLDYTVAGGIELRLGTVINKCLWLAVVTAKIINKHVAEPMHSPSVVEVISNTERLLFTVCVCGLNKCICGEHINNDRIGL